MEIARPGNTMAASQGVRRIDRSDLPHLAVPTGIFGSQADRARADANGDNHAHLMSCLVPFHCEG
jgi:hypothetical protein